MPDSSDAARRAVADMSGAVRFAEALRRGHVPPPGPLFLSRFLHQDPNDWLEIWNGTGPSDLINQAMFGDSLDRIAGEILDKIATHGATLPEIGAAEQAVTLHLTAFTVGTAFETLKNAPDFVWEKYVPQPGQFTGWHPTHAAPAETPYWDYEVAAPVADRLALAIRERVSETDLELMLAAGEDFDVRPGDCLRVLRFRIEEAASNLVPLYLDVDDEDDWLNDDEFIEEQKAGELEFAIAKLNDSKETSG